MPEHVAPVSVKQITVEAVVIRACPSCGAPGVKDGVILDRCAVCAAPITREDLGVVASWHRNPFVRAMRKLRGHGPVSMNELADNEE